jgi:hypothetical protein
MRKLRPALVCICLLAYGIFFPASILQEEPVVFANDLPAEALPTVTPSMPAPELIQYTAALSTPSAVPSVIPAILTPTRLLPTATWEPVPFDTCMKLALPPCLTDAAIQLPPAPPGFTWKRLEDSFTFSAYAHPSEDYFMGDMVDIPGIQNLKAKDGFLFGVYGIGMQGGGYIWRLNKDHQMAPIYISYIAGHWELNGENVIISDQWRYEDGGKSVDQDQIANIRLVDARFAMMDEPTLTPYYSVAASPRIPIGTQLYVPGLAAYGGKFEVQDRGGAFGPDSQRFDIYVGKDINSALEFIRLGPARSNLPVYALEHN